MSQQEKKLHLNEGQLLFFVIKAMISVVIAGRAFGKSYGLTAAWLLIRILYMPKSVGGLLIPSYEGMEKIMGKIYKFWGEWGFIEGIHYVINVAPPKFFKSGYNTPKKDFKHYISFWNGSGLFVLSAKAKHNGSDLDYLAVEEAKLIRESIYREIVLAVRGNADHFGGNPMHLSQLIVTDMPRAEDHDWFMEHEKGHTEECVQMQLALTKKIVKQQELLDKTAEKPERSKIEKKIEVYEKWKDEIAQHTVFFANFDTLLNIHSLGMQYVRSMSQSMSAVDVAISLLGYKPRKVDGGFYALLSRKRHGYRQPALNHYQDCRADADLDPNQGLHIALDYNVKICCMVIGQYSGGTPRFIRSMHVLQPKFLDDLIDAFALYYKHHGNRTIYYHYDPQALQGRNALSNKRYVDRVVELLHAHGFYVVKQYHKQVWTYADRYKLWKETLSEDGSFQYNTEANTWLESSMFLAKAGQDSNGKIIKIKKDETDDEKDQRLTTHHTEAADNLLIGMQQHSSSSFNM